MKKLISSILSAALLLTTSLPAQAAAVTPEVSSELVDIHGFACYERDGQFYTMLDGDECLVIDLDKICADVVKEGVSVQSTYSGDYLDPPEGWTNNKLTLAIPGSMYTDTCDLTNGDYCSPIHQMVYHGDGNYKVSIKTNQWASNTYILNVWVHLHEWIESDQVAVTFSVFGHSHTIITGSPGNEMDGYALKFQLPEGSKAEKSFQYELGYWKAT